MDLIYLYYLFIYLFMPIKSKISWSSRSPKLNKHYLSLCTLAGNITKGTHSFKLNVKCVET